MLQKGCTNTGYPSPSSGHKIREHSNHIWPMSKSYLKNHFRSISIMCYLILERKMAGVFCVHTCTGKTHLPETSTKENMKIASTTFGDCSPVMYQQHEKNQVVQDCDSQELEGDVYLTRYALGKWLPTWSFNHYVQLSSLCEKNQRNDPMLLSNPGWNRFWNNHL